LKFEYYACTYYIAKFTLIFLMHIAITVILTKILSAAVHLCHSSSWIQELPNIEAGAATARKMSLPFY
jgi:hypothetical protein